MNGWDLVEVTFNSDIRYSYKMLVLLCRLSKLSASRLCLLYHGRRHGCREQSLQEKKALSLGSQVGLNASATTQNRFGLGGVPIAQPASRPAPLRIDDKGREIDAQGNVVQKPKDTLSSLKV